MKRNEVERQEPQAPSTNDLPLDTASMRLADAAVKLSARVAELEANNKGSLKAATYWKEQHDRAAKRVAELEGELARAKWDVSARNAHSNALRGALESGNRRLGYWCDLHGSLPEDVSALAGMQAALASTPAASLAAHDAEVRNATIADVFKLGCEVAGAVWAEAAPSREMDARACVRLVERIVGTRSPRTEEFVCPGCGPGVAADEDGCCATCGDDTAIRALAAQEVTK